MAAIRPLIPFSTLFFAGLLALLAVKGTLPAGRARAAAVNKHARLVAKRDALKEEIATLRSEQTALATDFQYARRLERLYFRDGPQPGD